AACSGHALSSARGAHEIRLGGPVSSRAGPWPRLLQPRKHILTSENDCSRQRIARRTGGSAGVPASLLHFGPDKEEHTMPGAKILVVDDDLPLLHALRDLLASDGFEAEGVASAE